MIGSLIEGPQYGSRKLYTRRGFVVRLLTGFSVVAFAAAFELSRRALLTGAVVLPSLRLVHFRTHLRRKLDRPSRVLVAAFSAHETI